MDSKAAPRPMSMPRFPTAARIAACITLLAASTCASEDQKPEYPFYNPGGKEIPFSSRRCSSTGGAPTTCEDVTGTMKMNLYGPPIIDHFIDMTEFCDLRDDAPISDKCIGFVGGIVEVKVWSDLAARQFKWAHYGGACIPRGFTVAEIFQRIRPWLRERGYTCAGICPSASYVETALNAIFRCE